MMRLSLKKLAQECLEKQPENLEDTHKWIFKNYPAESYLLVNKIEWHKRLRHALEVDNSLEELKTFYDYFSTLIN